ncbi:hypothetical protein TNCV_3479391 [Trichonephila clavipes]|nr:hypothetical protein TNCV_3479391 [Trichonephila clavipes]
MVRIILNYGQVTRTALKLSSHPFSTPKRVFLVTTDLTCISSSIRWVFRCTRALTATMITQLPRSLFLVAFPRYSKAELTPRLSASSVERLANQSPR